MEKIFTIIVTYNGMPWIKDCLDSVVAESTVVIVDNLSKDETVAFVKAHYKNVIVLEQKENHGFGKANNIGIKYALEQKAEYTLLLNQDAKMEVGAIGKLTQFYKNNKHYGIISPIHCDWSGQYLEASFSSYVSQSNNKDFYSDYVLQKNRKQIYNLPFIAAACWFIKAEVYNTVGGFDPIFKHLGEDVNYAQRLKYHGFKIGVLPSCKVMHDTGDRKQEKIEIYSNKYFYKLDYRSKIKFANINIDNWQGKVKYSINQVFKDVLVAFLKLNFKHVIGGVNQIKLLRKIENQCGHSRAINIEKGNHYLN